MKCTYKFLNNVFCHKYCVQNVNLFVNVQWFNSWKWINIYKRQKCLVVFVLLSPVFLNKISVTYLPSLIYLYLTPQKYTLYCNKSQILMFTCIWRNAHTNKMFTNKSHESNLHGNSQGMIDISQWKKNEWCVDKCCSTHSTK